MIPINLQDKIVLAHKGFFNKECKKIYRENSWEVCKISSAKDYISIIELDVRKSKDGILYCYHGNFFQYYFSLKIPRNFSDLQKKYRVNSLEEILQVITEDKILCLDLKSNSITRPDILNALKDKKFKEVILASTSISISFLERFNNLPQGFVKKLNGNIFCNFYDLEKLRAKNYKYLEVIFPFQVNGRLIQDVSKLDMELRCAHLFFMSKESYWRKIDKYNIRHVSSDFI